MDPAVVSAIEAELVAQHGPGSAARIHTGLAQVVARWRAEDGDGAKLRELALAHFVSDSEALKQTAKRLEYSFEMLDGHHNEIERELSRFQQLDEGPERPIDALLGSYSPTAHLSEDLFQSKIGFAALLNFPLTTLAQRVGEGAGWSREQWALARLAERFEFRVPAPVQQEIARVAAEAESYIDRFNIRMDKLVGADGKPQFPEGLSLISHWGLRDEIRAQYGKPGALERQRLVAQVMDRIIRQEIPAAVIDSAKLEWDPVRNVVRAPGADWHPAEREADVRYRHLGRVFQSVRSADAHFPGYRSYIERVFERDREMAETRMRELLESVLRSDVATQVGATIAKRLGRPLEPFDIWYPGFRAAGSLDESKLAELTRQRYPTVRSFQKDLPQLLRQLGFTFDTASYLADHIVVDPARGPGHAAGAQRRDDRAHLRTRVGKDGMDYKGFNIAIHELGHNVEQVFSMSRIDHTLLSGVPNGGFTEAFAFLFQARDRELLGQAKADPQADALRTLDRFWSAFEISGVAILDMEIWHWMYEHPAASAAELRDAMVRLAQDLWNRYYAPVLGVREAILPAIYSHIIAFGLYTPDYPLGFLITFQIEQHLRGRNLGTEMERMCRQGRIAPDVWMQQAVGSPISSQPLLDATAAALRTMGG